MKRVVIIGGGFGGLYAAKALSREPIEITLVDKKNHHLFQPLLYQVATAVLSAGEIASPIRSIFHARKNIRVILDEVTGVDLEAREVHLKEGVLPYDGLVFAPGARTSYFGHDEWAGRAAGLKTVEDALDIRRRVLTAFERAEKTLESQKRREFLTFVVVGGGPTGVELAGAIAEIATMTLHRDFRWVDPREAEIILLEGGERILGSFSPKASAYAARILSHLGVRVRTREAVQEISEGLVVTTRGAIRAQTVLWAAGVRPSALNETLGAPLDRTGRVLVEPDLSLPGYPDVFAVGDAVAVPSPRGGFLPGVAPVAIQEGRQAARNLLRRFRGDATRPFQYLNKGNLATIGRAHAVAEFGKVSVRGRLAWILWLLLHVLYLIGFQSRLVVLIRWGWAYLVYQRGARLIYSRALTMDVRSDDFNKSEKITRS